MKKNKVNILVLNAIFHEGGSEKITYDIFKRINKNNFCISFCTLYEPGPWGETFIREGYHFYCKLMANKFDLRVLYKLTKIIKKNFVDVIYLLNQPATLFWGYLIGKRHNIPVISAVHDTFIIKKHLKLRIYSLLLPRVQKVIAVADRQKNHILNSINMDKSRLDVIYNGVDHNEFSLDINIQDEKLKIGINPDNIIVGLIARFHKVKGIDVFLKAAKVILKKHSNISFLIIGDGPEFERMLGLSKKLGIESNIKFLGYRTDINRLIHLIDIAVLSSYTEAMPISILEYMITGKAIVSTNVGGIGELIDDGINGFLIEPGNPNALADKISYFINSPNIIKRLGKSAKSKAMLDFSIEATVERTERLIESIVIKKNNREKKN